MCERRKRELKELNLIDNFLFGTMVSYPEIGEKFSRYLLEIILQRKIHKITVTGQRVIYGKDTDSHGIRIDVEIKEEYDGVVQTIYDLEPDLKEGEKGELPHRTRYYHSMIDKNSLGTGTNYKSLPNVYVIMITDFDPFGENRMVYTMKTLCVEKPELSYDDGARTIYLYTKGTVGNPPQELKELLVYMEKTRQENAVNTVLKDIDEMVQSIKKDSEVAVGYMHWMVTKEDILEEGRAEGMAMGERKKIVSLMCKKLRKGKSIETIADELGEDLEIVRNIGKAASAFAPKYDEEKILESLLDKS